VDADGEDVERQRDVVLRRVRRVHAVVRPLDAPPGDNVVNVYSPSLTVGQCRLTFYGRNL
jgi:hypothetical protein